MTREELLRPRWIVLGNFPGDEWFKVGQIIKADLDLPHIHTAEDSEDPDNWLVLEPDTYPQLFRKLEWWEKRKEKYLPKYLKFKANNKVVEVHQYNYDSERFFIADHEIGSVDLDGDTFQGYNLSWVIPATEEEYLNQK
jgi:hypothetical protein